MQIKTNFYGICMVLSILFLSLGMVTILTGCGTDNSTRTNTGSNTVEQVADVDYDLTTMSSDMVYATVYQMLLSPNHYLGATVRMSGPYYASYYNVTGLTYHYCIISDATACCTSGLEFVWGDGSHVYPDEYPDYTTEIVVTGTFSTYMENGYQYCVLLDATLEIAD